ncbi:uncharacterized protein PG998_000500 [Apiospora kogelbergensis]|uniref:Uncharacterized protein n=1 Tax=Apiospora kogelbergensis TaxID=1337665 RepID=A0AAW0QX41_9PEZI
MAPALGVVVGAGAGLDGFPALKPGNGWPMLTGVFVVPLGVCAGGGLAAAWTPIAGELTAEVCVVVGTPAPAVVAVVVLGETLWLGITGPEAIEAGTGVDRVESFRAIEGRATEAAPGRAMPTFEGRAIEKPGRLVCGVAGLGADTELTTGEGLVWDAVR